MLGALLPGTGQPSAAVRFAVVILKALGFAYVGDNVAAVLVPVAPVALSAGGDFFVRGHAVYRVA